MPNGENLRTGIAPGMLLDGRFQISHCVGRGGMGTVYQASDIGLSRQVAIKVLHPRYSADASGVSRFIREARILSQLRHENILSAYSIGSTEGVVYAAFEFLPGKSLGQHLEEHGRMSPESALPILLPICRALTYAHKHRVLHRDLKPDNVVLSGSPEMLSIKVVDFGLAALLAGEDMQKLTKTGEVVGDVRYMSPEQCRGEKLDERSDVYSFGCLMYHVLTGQAPWDSDDPVAIMYKHISEKPSPFAKKLSVAPALESITLKAMAKDRTKRYLSFCEISELLEQFQRNPELSVANPERNFLTLDGKIRTVYATVMLAVAVVAVLIALNIESIVNYCYERRIEFSDQSVPLSLMSELGQRLERQDKLDEACQWYQKAIEASSASTKDEAEAVFDAHLALARIRRKEHQEREARRELEAAMLLAKQAIARGPLSRSFRNKILHTLMKSDSLNASSMVIYVCEIAGAFESAGCLEDATKLWQQAIGSAPDADTKAQFQDRFGLVLAQQNRLLEAQSVLDSAFSPAASLKNRQTRRAMVVAILTRQGHRQLAARYAEQDD